MNVTFFPNEQAFTLQQQDMTLEQLRTLILETTARTKDELPWLKLAVFGDKRSLKKCLRHDANVLNVTGIELDYDDKVMPFEEAVALIKKAQLQALVFTSANYKVAAPKWRMLLPTSCALPPKERVKLVKRVNGLFGGIFSGETFTLSQSYFFGSVNSNPEHRAVITGGDFIDLRSDLDAGALGKRKQPKPNGHDIEAPAYIRNAKGEGRGTSDAEHDVGGDSDPNETLIGNITGGKSYYLELRGLSYRWVKDGAPADTVVQMLQGLMDASIGPRDANWHERRNDTIPKLVASAVEKKARTGKSKLLNDEAFKNLEKWVPALFRDTPFNITDAGVYRITSEALGCDLSISPESILDFDLEVGLSPLDLVIKYSEACKNVPDDKKLEAAFIALSERLGHKPASVRIKLIPFEEFTLDNSPTYLVQRLLASSALNLVWGPPKCGKTFWVFDVLMHVALGRPYRDRRIQQGTVVYCGFEGTRGLRRRREAWRIKHLQNYDAKVPLYFVTLNLDLINEHPALIEAIQTQLPTGDKPIAVVLDTLNRSFVGSESSDEDMSAYVKASDAIREAFDCSAIIVHHCGINETRPRGHTSLTGAVDAQLRVERNDKNDIIVTVEWMKDDEGEGSKLASRLEVIEVGADADGLAMTSCVIVATELPKLEAAGLSKNEATMLGVLEEAGEAGFTVQEWNERAREAGLGRGRKADLRDWRLALQKKNRIYLSGERWVVPF